MKVIKGLVAEDIVLPEIRFFEASRKLVDLVNPLVAEAFGESVIGNCKINQSTIWSPRDYLLYIFNTFHKGPLHYIRGFFRRLDFDWTDENGRPRLIGDFSTPIDDNRKIIPFEQRDGSVIRVLPEYEAPARRYAELYEERFRKEVVIKIDGSLDRRIMEREGFHYDSDDY
jgi:hypothetical protein